MRGVLLLLIFSFSCSNKDKSVHSDNNQPEDIQEDIRDTEEDTYSIWEDPVLNVIGISAKI